MTTALTDLASVTRLALEWQRRAIAAEAECERLRAQVDIAHRAHRIDHDSLAHCVAAARATVSTLAAIVRALGSPACRKIVVWSVPDHGVCRLCGADTYIDESEVNAEGDRREVHRDDCERGMAMAWATANPEASVARERTELSEFERVMP